MSDTPTTQMSIGEHGTYVTVKLDTPMVPTQNVTGSSIEVLCKKLCRSTTPPMYVPTAPQIARHHKFPPRSALAQAGKKLQAIKSYRAATGATLAEPSGVIDKLS